MDRWNPLYRGVIYVSHEVDKLRINWMIQYSHLNNGFVLRGSDESPNTTDNAACVSIVSKISLTFTYDIRD